MMRKEVFRWLVYAGAIAAVGMPVPASATTPDPAEIAARPRAFITRHNGVFNGKRIDYEARVEEMILRDPQGRPAASLFSTSYIAAGAKGAERPVIFAFNGGPGSASVWLHMGILGPRRVVFRDDIHPETTPPFHIGDNPDCPLDVADIVLIDPVNTGLSRILKDGKEEDFLGTLADAKATVDFITRWVNDHHRWNAPKFLFGESYGTVRAAVTARLLVGGPSTTGHLEATTLNGVMIIGQALDMAPQTLGDDRRYAEVLPTLAATAWYHNEIDRRGRDVATVVAEARDFAAGDYWSALFKGAALPAADVQRIAGRLHDFTGIPVETIIAHHLRIDGSDGINLLLADRDRQAGLYDSRFTLPLGPRAGDPVADDPAMAQYVPGYMGAYNLYARDELKVDVPDIYRGIEWKAISAKWDWGDGPGRRPTREYASDLAVAMRRNPAMRLFVGAGYYDVVTPLGAAEYVVKHAGIPLGATTFHYYEAGHMVYVGADNRHKLADDIRTFVSAP